MKTITNNSDGLDDFIFNKMSSQGIVGLSIATIQDGKLDINKGFGFSNFAKGTSATSDTVYCIGSVTKSFTASGILKLVEEDKIHLDDPVNKYLPIELGKNSPVLIKHLLSHSSGISPLGYAESTLTAFTDYNNNWLPISNSNDLIVFMNGVNEWTISEPGEKYAYLNEGYILLGRVIEEVSNLKYSEFIKEYILKPLAMNHSTYDQNDVENYEDVATPYITSEEGEKIETRYPYGQLIADGGLMSNVLDMTKYIQMLMGCSESNGQILSGQSLEKLLIPKIQTDDIPLGNTGKRYYAYGHRVKSDFFDYNLVYHSGSVYGSSAYMGFIPDREVGVVVMASGGYFLEDIGEYALALLLDEDPDEAPYLKRIRQLDRLTGKYTTFRDTSEYHVSRQWGILYLESNFLYRKWSIPLIPVELDKEVKRFMIYGFETKIPVDFIEKDGKMLMHYQNNLAKKLIQKI
jgi:CubicO group peptidase (beta-lactamase class C family)